MRGIANCGCHPKDTAAPEQVLQGRQCPKPTAGSACHWGGHNVAMAGGRSDKHWHSWVVRIEGRGAIVGRLVRQNVLIAGAEADVVTTVWMLCCDGEEAGIQMCLPCAGRILLCAWQWGGLMQMSRKNTEELTADERRVKNKCEKLDHGTWHLEMKQDFSGRL